MQAGITDDSVGTINLLFKLDGGFIDLEIHKRFLTPLRSGWGIVDSWKANTECTN
jgi:hypothetical protein